MSNPVDDAFEGFMNSLPPNEQLAPESQEFFQMAAGFLNGISCREIKSLDNAELAGTYAARRLMLYGEVWGEEDEHTQQCGHYRAVKYYRHADHRRDFGAIVNLLTIRFAVPLRSRAPFAFSDRVE